jgi:hypothetical protein
MVPFVIQETNGFDWPAWIQAGCAFVAIIITGLGTLFVVKSFLQQKKINSEQQEINRQQMEINRLAMEKDRREIRPYFKFSLLRPLERDVVITLKLENALAFEVIFEYSKNGRYNVNPNVMLQSEWPVDHQMEIMFGLNDDQNNHTDSIGITIIKFKDEAGRAYSQSISYMNQRVDVSVPRLIENYSIWQV